MKYKPVIHYAQWLHPWSVCGILVNPVISPWLHKPNTTDKRRATCKNCKKTWGK